MPILLILLAAGVFGWMWFARRGSTLTRTCRWRLDRSVGPGHYACSACGAVCDVAEGKVPRDCLRPPAEPAQQ